MPGFSRVKTSTITFKGVEFLLRLRSPKFEIVQSFYDKLMKKKRMLESSMIFEITKLIKKGKDTK